jgi:hypothetical protein
LVEKHSKEIKEFFSKFNWSMIDFVWFE